MSDVAMPRLSDSMEEGTILKWLKSDGDEVSKGEELVEIETDKANMTYEADEAGTLEIVAQEGDTLAVGETIARIGEGGGGDDSGDEEPDEEPGDKEEDTEPAAEEDEEPEAEDGAEEKSDEQPEPEAEEGADEQPEPEAEEGADEQPEPDRADDGRGRASPMGRGGA